MLLISITFSFYIGTWFAGKNTVPSTYKHKYDSLNRVVKTQDKIMMDNKLIKDSLRAIEHELNYKADSIREAGKVQEANLKARREALKTQRLRESEAEIAKEMTEVFKEAHPAPLFDSSVGPDITIGKNVGIHFLERNEEAEDFQIKLVNIEELVKNRESVIRNLKIQLDRSKVDSLALQNKVITLATANTTKDEEMKDSTKAFKKEIKKQKVQKVVATVVAGAVIVGTFILEVISN